MHMGESVGDVHRSILAWGTFAQLDFIPKDMENIVK